MVADNTVNFSSYPARDACKAIGGRLPTKDELAAIYTYRVSKFGNNFQSDTYWSSTEDNAYDAYYESFSDGSQSNTSKLYSTYVRCVQGW